MIRKIYNKYATERLRYQISVARNYIRRLFSDRLKIKKQQVLNLENLNRISGKKKIHVAFFVFSESQWKFGDLYELFDKDEKYVPMIVVCPLWQKEQAAMMFEVMQTTYTFFRKKNYNVLMTYDFNRKEWIDIKSSLNIDIIFWAFPYSANTKFEYSIDNFPDCLSCYVPYFYGTVKNVWAFDLLFHNLQWILFCESVFHKKMYEKKQRLHGVNVYVSGYPLFDLFKEESSDIFQWKQGVRLKKVIWAPHHTIFRDGYSNFLKVHALMLEIAEIYKNEVQFVFKPHPMLRSKLYQISNWGKDKTDAYYRKWIEMPNTMLWEGSYISLFNSSDAMLHDCGSFTIEYLYTLKPVFYFSSNNRKKGLNKVGLLAYESHYLGNNKEDIMMFMDIVLGRKEDVLYDKRKFFKSTCLLPPGGNDASWNIYRKIDSYFDKK